MGLMWEQRESIFVRVGVVTYIDRDSIYLYTYRERETLTIYIYIERETLSINIHI